MFAQRRCAAIVMNDDSSKRPPCIQERMTIILNEIRDYSGLIV